MIENKGHGFIIKAGIDRIQYGTSHRNRKVQLKHLRDIWQHHGDGVAFANTGFT